MGEVTISGLNGYTSGTTTAGYVTAVSIKGYGGINGKTIIHITDEDGATKTMYYKINGYVSSSPSCAATAVTAETDIVSAAVVVDTAADKPYDHIDVQVRNHSAACNYRIDWMTY